MFQKEQGYDLRCICGGANMSTSITPLDLDIDGRSMHLPLLLKKPCLTKGIDLVSLA